MTHTECDRRAFLRSAGSLVVGFALLGGPLTVGIRTSTSGPRTSTSRMPQLSTADVDSWLTISVDSKVTIYTGYIDAGTGIETVIRQVAADELDVSLDVVRTVLGDTELTPYSGISYGSRGVFCAGHQVRIAAAAARDAVRKLGAEHLGVSPEKVVLERGVVRTAEGGDRSFSYGELFGGRAFNITLATHKVFHWPVLETKVPLKSPRQRQLIGRSLPRVDIPAKVFAMNEFVHDVRIPNMWHGRVIRPPSERATNLVRVLPESIKDIPNSSVYWRGNFVGVIAPREEDAVRAAQQLQVKWQTCGPPLPVHGDRYDAARRTTTKRIEREEPIGDAKAAIAGAKYKFERIYEYPYQLHAMSGPSCSVADVRPDGSATVWSGTQAPHEDRDMAAHILGFHPDRVRLIWRQAAGSYGRLGADDSVADAVILSQLAGRPIRVQWMRHEEHAWETVSPAMVIDIRAGIDHNGRISGLQYQHWTAQHDLARRGHTLAWRHIGEPQDENWAWGGGVIGKHYDIPNFSIEKHITHEIVRPASLRAPGYAQSYFALESFVDELATEVRMDPLRFRLQHLKDQHAIAVLKTVAQRATWLDRIAGTRGAAFGRYAEGRGIAFIEEGGALVATVAQVIVDSRSGKVTISKIFAVGDHGEIMNPDGLVSQYEGAILQGVSRSLFEEATYEDSKRTSLDWVSYPVLRYDALPDLDIHPINNPERGFIGAGEAPTATIPAAIANAIFDATGVRLRVLPFTPQRVKSLIDA